MVTRIQRDSIIPSGLADATREPHTMRIANPEEGESRGETWVFLRAIVLLVGAVILVGYLIT